MTIAVSSCGSCRIRSANENPSMPGMRPSMIASRNFCFVSDAWRIVTRAASPLSAATAFIPQLLVISSRIVRFVMLSSTTMTGMCKSSD